MTEGKEPENSSAAAAVEKKHPANSMMSEKISDVLLQLKPIFHQISVAIETAQPYVSKGNSYAKKYWKQLEPYQPDLLIPAFIGLALILAGGMFPTMIASVEAVRASGTWPGIKTSFINLKNNYNISKAASAKDDLLDADRNGVPDILELKRNTYVHRKSLLLLKSINIEQVSDALQQLVTALIAILATLRLHFAYVLTIGASISKMCHDWCGTIATDSVLNIISEENRRLAPFIVLSCFRIAGFILAWIFTRYVFAFYIAMSGGKLFVESVSAYLKQMKKLSSNHWVFQNESQLSSALGGLGFVFQCYMGFKLILIIRLILLPLLFAEWLVTCIFGILA
jgi:hypothetical protein